MPPLVLLALTLAAPIQKKDSQPPPKTIPELESRIRAVLERTHTPAAGVALVTRDSVLWVAGFGKADVASGRDATAETLFRIGSTSKAFVSLLVLLAEQEGKLHLDDPVRRYAPEIWFENRWEATDPVRIVNLLEHTTGWDDLALRDYAKSDSTLTLRQGLDYTPATRTSRWRPGTRVAYCNSGPPVAAYIAEKLEGQTFETLVHDRLFAPIGMTSATYFPPEPRERLATLYHGDGKTPYPYWYIIERPAGAINASPRDMAAYVRFLLNRGAVRGRQIVPRAAIERMERPQSSLTARAGLPVGYGLHLSSYVADTGFVWVGHDGGVAGGLTVMAYRPDQGVGFAFMINSGNVAALRDIDRLVRGLLTREAPRPAPPAPAPLSPLARARAGWYVADNPRVQNLYFIERLLALAQVHVSGDSALTLDPLLGKARRYVPVTATLFRAASDSVPTLALVNDSLDGRPQAIEQMGYLLPRSYARIATPLVWLELAVAVAFLLASAASVLFALVWLPRRLFGKLRGAPHIWVRAWPAVASVALFLPVLLFVVSADDAISRFGTVTIWSVIVVFGTLLFPVAAVAGLVTVARVPRAELGRVLRAYALAASGLNVVVAAYLAWWGVIGWRSWG